MANEFFYRLYLTFSGIIFICACKNPASPGNSPATDHPIGYELQDNWPTLPANFIVGNPTGIGVDSNQRLYVFHRAGRTWPYLSSMPDSTISSSTLLVLGKDSGQVIRSWGANLFIMPHGLSVDNDNNIWVTDVALHQVFKFTEDGRLLMKLGEARIAGNDTGHFNRPTDVAVADDGSFYVSDGYENSRVIKFSRTGQYLFEWGKKGHAPGEFTIPHSICIGESGHIYVADRENNRVQVFDSAGKFIQQLVNENFGNITAVTYDASTKQLIATDDKSWLKLKHQGSDIIIFDSTRKNCGQFGRTGSYEGPLCWYHDVVVDKEGSIYVSDIKGNLIQKFKRRMTKK
jgi:peptidylamidoglycolate lyase